MGHGRLRIYVGAAPGVGKTYAMLQEAARRQSRGTDVVVGIVDTHGRAETRNQLDGLELLPLRQLGDGDRTHTELDLDGLIARRPQVAVVDEIAHTNAPGSRNAKRWQDVAELLEAGIDVISTVNIQHLESINDVVEEITGFSERDVIPDDIVRAADQVQLVDQTPEALRRRLAHGNVYPAERVDAALDNYFRVGNLSALRELALLWVADRVEDGLQRYREDHDISGTWDTRERVVVAVTGAPGNEYVIRRAARVASRSRGRLIGVHVRNVEGHPNQSDMVLDRHRQLLAAVGGQYREVAAGDVADALVRFARSQNATQIVLGASARSRWQELAGGSVINDVVRASGAIDVHVISPQLTETNETVPIRPRRVDPLPRRRRLWGWAIAYVGPAVLSAGMLPVRERVALSTNLLAFTLIVALTAVVGGFLPAAAASVGSFLLANWYFTPPYHTWSVGEPENLAELVVFLAVAAAIGYFVASSTKRAVEASRARGDAETLAALAGTVAAGASLDVLTEQMREVLDADTAAVLVDDGDGWVRVAWSGDGASPEMSGGSDFDSPLGAQARLVATGARRGAVDGRIFDAFCHHLAAAVDRDRLRRAAAETDRLADANALRAGLLAALSHDLRTPLAAIQAAASTLRQPDVATNAELVDEFTEAIVEHTRRLHSLLTNLLEMSRIQANAVQLDLRPTHVDEVLAAALAGIDRRGIDIAIDLPSDLPAVLADPVLFERVVANVLDNAVKWSPPGESVRVDGAAVGDRVAVRVVDRGPGIPPERAVLVTQPFQRLDDSGSVEGTGLGLAVASGFVDQLGGELEIEQTPGGGTTMTIRLPAARSGVNG